MIPSSIKVSFEDILKGYYDPNLVCNMKFDEVVRLTDENRYGQKAISVLKIEIPKELKYCLVYVILWEIIKLTSYDGISLINRCLGLF